MALVRTLARPMLSAIFIMEGVDQLRQPGAKADRVAPVTDLVSRSVPRAPKDTETLVRINGAAQVGAGVLFALGRFPRLTALILAGTLVPTTAGGHRFWEETDAAQRADQQTHFLKDAGLFGGLLFAAVAGRGGRKKRGGKPRSQSKGRSKGTSKSKARH